MGRDKYKKKERRNNRINFITAVVFLMLALCVYKMYDLQIQRHDYFSAFASDQHQTNSELEPERGEIFIKDRGENKNKLYPVATNKNFALVYAIPKEVEEPEKLAQRLYNFFDKKKVKKKAKEYFEKQDEKELKEKMGKLSRDISSSERKRRVNEIEQEIQNKKNDPQWREQREEAIQERIETKKEEIMSDYKESLKKENDPYERVQKKVEIKKLKEFYAFLASKRKEATITPQQLTIESNRVYKEKNKEKERLSLSGVSHLIKEHRYYPEGETGAHIWGFVNPNKQKNKGSYGLEGFFNQELSGEHGYIRSGPSSSEGTITLNDKNYKKPRHGSDMVLTIDRSVQFYVCRKLKEAVSDHGAEQGSVIAVNPQTGGIMAMCSYPTFNPNKYNKVEDIQVYNNPVIFGDYEPGSVFKTITMAAALDDKAISPHTTYQDKGKIEFDDWTIKNSDYESHGPHGKVDMNYALAHSLNTGAIFAMEQTGVETFADYVKEFGFGSKTGIELAGESKGEIKNLRRGHIPRIYGATASYGQGITATPLQLVMAYAAIANDGTLMKPYIAKKILSGDGKKEVTEPVPMRHVISEEASSLVSGMLVNVIEGGHAPQAGVEGYYVGGKTGTAQVASEEGGYGKKTIHTFIGSAPVEDPRFTMLVKLDDPKDVKYSASSAAPLFGDLADFMLNYYQIPKER